ncbi:MAG: ABC transporter substrate-binding protein [Deltaproteobacteria bacterium]|nr:ABC transporter substrate-binding protein [Deltaproteobacteria bacterium]
MRDLIMRKIVMSLVYLAAIALLAGGAVPAAQAAEDGQPVRIGYLQADIHQLACWVALERGFYQDQGLQVEVAGIFRAGPEEMSAFAAGELDMGYVGEAPATTAVANGAARVQVLAQVNTEGSALVVARDSSIQNVAGLAGHTAAIPGHSTVQDFLLQKALAQAKVPADQVKILVVKPPEMLAALDTSQIDAFIAWEPFPARAVTAGKGRVLSFSRDIWPAHPCCVLVADQKFLAARPQAARRMVAAHVEATNFIHQHPAEAVAIGMKYTGMDEATVKAAMADVNYTYKISVAGEREYVAFLSKLGYIKVADPDAFVAKFLNPKILEEVLAK